MSNARQPTVMNLEANRCLECDILLSTFSSTQFKDEQQHIPHRTDKNTKMLLRDECLEVIVARSIEKQDWEVMLMDLEAFEIYIS